MCVQFLKIKSVLPSAQKFAFLPCGKCEECRDSKKNEWTFRLRTELEWCRRHKWNIGFFTLTYNDACLPRLPREVFNSAPVADIPCFSRSDARLFIDNVRKRLNERWNVAGCKYILCCEYGSSTKRPHMHGLISFPSSYEVVDKVTGEVTTLPLDPRNVFDLIKSQWSLGFVFPRDFRGGRDSHGYEHKPFLLRGDIAGAAKYAAKYCCKDLDFYRSIDGLDLDKKSKLYKRCMPFHIQSRSIGLCLLDNLSNDELLKLFKSGKSFLGDNKTHSLPLYIRNKVLFSPRYEFKECKFGDWWYDFQDNKWRYKRGQGTHKRYVRREVTQFFVDNIKEIYAKRVEHYEDLFSRFTDSRFWLSRGAPVSDAALFADTAGRLSVGYGLNASRAAESYLLYFGISRDRCFAPSSVPPELQFLSRYKPLHFSRRCAPVSDVLYEHINRYFSFVVDCLKFVSSVDVQKRAELRRLVDLYRHSI